LTSDADADECNGNTPQDHHIESFDFTTNSRVETVDTRKRYISCVLNLDANSDLVINWRIHGPYNNYVPDGKAVETPRLRDDVSERPIDGCIEFGPFHHVTVAQFLGTSDEESANSNDSCGKDSAKNSTKE
jgi:hypothetical protein